MPDSEDGEEFCEELWDALCPSSDRGQCIVAIAVAAVIFVVTVCCLTLPYATVTPVSVTVKSASVSRLAAANNATSSSYGVSLTVAVRNPNFALTAMHAAPLNADLRVAGRRFGSSDGGAVRLADGGDELKPKDTAEYRVETAGELQPEEYVPFGGVAAVEVALAGEVKYLPFHGDRHALSAFCQMKLQMPLQPGAAQAAPVFQPVKCVGSSSS